jgi:molecular chaperone GrpE
MSRRKRKKLEQTEVETEAAPPIVEAPAAPADDPPAEAAGEAKTLEAVEPVESEIERLQKEASAMRDLAQRKQAEFENYRKRMERERSDLSRYAGAEVVREILPVVDNLERALRAAPGSSDDQIRDGVAIILRQLQDILSRIGLSEIESLGKPFDPHVHEAVSQTETEEHPEGTVLDVFQRGYQFKDRLLRPAMVSVARRPSADHDAEEPSARAEGATRASEERARTEGSSESGSESQTLSSSDRERSSD